MKALKRLKKRLADYRYYPAHAATASAGPGNWPG